MTKSFEKLVSLLGEKPIQYLEGYMKKDSYNYIDIELEFGIASIENRNWYCDRGRYIIKISPNNIRKFYSGLFDIFPFPRYYFIFSNAITELCEFLDFRELKIVNVILKEVNQ